jgi:hypothetical protein
MEKREEELQGLASESSVVGTLSNDDLGRTGAG